MGTQGLVQDREALLGRPQTPLVRDTQMAELRACFSGDLAGVKPIHAWVHGPPGTGKTLCVQHLLRTEAAAAGALPLYVNCREQFTFLGVIGRLLDVVKPLRPLVRTRERELALLRLHLTDRKAVIALDEIDVLPDRDAADLLHHLCSLPHTSVICIAPTREALLRLPEAVRSRLAPRQVHFPRYASGELQEILRAVAHRALAPGAWSEATLATISDHSQGDARRALALLRHAVQRAEDAAATVLLPDHLVLPNFEHFSRTVEDELSELSTHHRLLHDVVLSRQPVGSAELEAEYRNLCERREVEPVATRTLTGYLTSLCLRRVLTRERGAGTSGWVYRTAPASRPGSL